MICRSFKHFSQKHADHFVPQPYQPENNDIPVQAPPKGFDALRTVALSLILTPRRKAAEPQSSAAGSQISRSNSAQVGRFKNS